MANGTGGYAIPERTGFSAGDVNGDGIEDRIIATSNVHYVVFGQEDGMEVELSSIDNGIGGFIIEAGEAIVKSNSGIELDVSVRSAGDVNGDGLGDLIARF